MIKDFDSEKRIDILLAALDERYKSIHIIRDRLQSVCLWALGIFFGIGGWIIQSDIMLTCLLKGIYVLAVLIIFVVLRFIYLEDLRAGFKGQQRVATKIEKALEMFTPGFFDGSSESIYPKSWEYSGQENGDGRFFEATCMLLYVGVGFLISTILLKGILF